MEGNEARRRRAFLSVRAISLHVQGRTRRIGRARCGARWRPSLWEGGDDEAGRRDGVLLRGCGAMPGLLICWAIPVSRRSCWWACCWRPAWARWPIRRRRSGRWRRREATKKAGEGAASPACATRRRTCGSAREATGRAAGRPWGRGKALRPRVPRPGLELRVGVSGRAGGHGAVGLGAPDHRDVAAHTSTSTAQSRRRPPPATTPASPESSAKLTAARQKRP